MEFFENSTTICPRFNKDNTVRLAQPCAPQQYSQNDATNLEQIGSEKPLQTSESEKRLFVFVAEWSKDQYQRWLLSRTYRHRHGSHRLYLQSLQTHLQQVRRGKSLTQNKNPPLRKATSDLRSRGEIGHKLVLASLLLSPL